MKKWKFAALAAGLVIVASIVLTASRTSTPAARSTLPPAKSLAGDLSDQQQGFIDRMDAACVFTYNEMQAELDALSRKSGAGPQDLEYETLFHSGVKRQLAAFKALGEPPERKELFEKWLRNVETRVELQKKRIARLRAGDSQAVRQLAWDSYELKREANITGRRLGSTICTSNGPGSGND